MYGKEVAVIKTTKYLGIKLPSSKMWKTIYGQAVFSQQINRSSKMILPRAMKSFNHLKI